MEKNSVVVDLDKYEELIIDLHDTVNEVMELKEMMKNNFLISKNTFQIKEDDGELRLAIDTKELENIVNSIDGYVVETPYYRQVTISGYQFKIVKVVE